MGRMVVLTNFCRGETGGLGGQPTRLESVAFPGSQRPLAGGQGVLSRPLWASGSSPVSLPRQVFPEVLPAQVQEKLHCPQVLNQRLPVIITAPLSAPRPGFTPTL